MGMRDIFLSQEGWDVIIIKLEWLRCASLKSSQLCIEGLNPAVQGFDFQIDLLFEFVLVRHILLTSLLLKTNRLEVCGSRRSVMCIPHTGSSLAA